jgi:hypothetical protein
MPCRTHAVPLPFSAPDILRKCPVLRESTRGSRKYPKCWYASHNNLRGTLRGSREKPNAGTSPTCRLWTANVNSHTPCRAHAALCHDLERSRFQNDMVMAWHGLGMTRVNQTRPHCVNQMGKTQSKSFWHGMTGERHGRGMGTAWYVWISLTFHIVLLCALWMCS